MSHPTKKQVILERFFRANFLA